jgi:serine phosphatase RsbU (regulator of sigma subunit)
MEAQLGVAKINKYASSESGDTLEVVERPGGGISVVLADGQRSGRSAKRISNMVVRKVIALLAEGVRDGAAARAAADYLYTHRSGKVQSTLNILSLDLDSQTLVISRNNPAPVLVKSNGSTRILEDESVPVGVYKNTRPVITEFDLEAGLMVACFSDGITNAGQRNSQRLDSLAFFERFTQENFSPQEIANGLLDEALTLDEGRASDDISVVVLGVLPLEGDQVRRMALRLPLK